MGVREGEAGTRRRRRTPEAAQAEIIDAAERLLRERPFRELTVDEVMRRTGLSRPSFYVYFKDRHELVLRIVEHLGGEIQDMANRWLETAGDTAMLRSALDGIVDVYARHAPALRALADAAVDDPHVEQAYGALVQRFVDLTSDHIQDEINAGNVGAVDAREVGKALTWMGERYLYHSFGPDRALPPPAIARTLHTIYERTLYGG